MSENIVLAGYRRRHPIYPAREEKSRRHKGRMT